MIPPKYRAPASAICIFLSLTPIAVTATKFGQSQSTKLAATSQRSDRQRLVANQINVDNCYEIPLVIKGSSMSLMGQAQSDCVKDKAGTHFGYIGIQNGETVILETFVIKEINATLSQIQKEQTQKEKSK